MTAAHDVTRWHCEWDILKYDDDATTWAARKLGKAPQGVDLAALGVSPYDIAHVDGNLLTTAGLTRLVSLLLAAGGQGLTNTSARIGVGNGSTTAVVGDTDLSAASGSGNRQFQVMDATYPSAAAAVATFQSTFGTSLANFSWNELGIDIGTPTVTAGTTVNATLLNHKSSLALGTKTSSFTWVVQSTVTFS